MLVDKPARVLQRILAVIEGAAMQQVKLCIGWKNSQSNTTTT